MRLTWNVPIQHYALHNVTTCIISSEAPVYPNIGMREALVVLFVSLLILSVVTVADVLSNVAFLTAEGT